MRREERESILRQGIVAPETPRDRRQRDGLVEDLRSSPFLGRPLHLRLRNFRPGADSYLASLGGPLPYMARLREIEAATAAHVGALTDVWRSLAVATADGATFSRCWRAAVGRWSFDEVNDLIQRHNRWYPVESRLPMDPRTGGFASVNGEDYRRRPLDARWALEQCPADRAAALASGR